MTTTNISIGDFKIEGYSNVSHKELSYIETESVENIECYFHLQKMDVKERQEFFDQAHRILSKGGKMKVTVPYCKSTFALSDPDSKWPLFSEVSFLHQGTRFDQNAFFIFADESWKMKSEEARTFAMRHYYDVVSAMVVDFTKK